MDNNKNDRMIEIVKINNISWLITLGFLVFAAFEYFNNESLKEVFTSIGLAILVQIITAFFTFPIINKMNKGEDR